MNWNTWLRLILLVSISVQSLPTPAQSLMDNFYRGQKAADEAERGRLENEMMRRQLEQQKIDARRRDEEYSRQQKERQEQHEKQQRQQTLEARLDDLQKKMADQDALQKQLLESMQKRIADEEAMQRRLIESQAREDALRKEVEDLKNRAAEIKAKKK